MCVCAHIDVYTYNCTYTHIHIYIHLYTYSYNETYISTPGKLSLVPSARCRFPRSSMRRTPRRISQSCGSQNVLGLGWFLAQYLPATSWNPLEWNFLRKPGQKVLLEVAWVELVCKRRWNYLPFVLKRFCSAHACFHQAEKFFDTTPAFFFPVSSHFLGSNPNFGWLNSDFSYWLVASHFLIASGFAAPATPWREEKARPAPRRFTNWSMADNVADILFIQADSRVKPVYKTSRTGGVI